MGGWVGYLDEEVHKELGGGLVDLKGVAGDVDELGLGEELVQELEAGSVGGGLEEGGVCVCVCVREKVEESEAVR